MAKFTDTNGIEHELRVTVQTVRLCREQLQFDLPKIVLPGSKEVERFLDDPLFTCELLYFVSEHRKPEGERLPTAAFYDGLAGDALDEAQLALIDAISDFFPRPEHRAFLRCLKAKAVNKTDRVFRLATKKLHQMESETQEPSTSLDSQSSAASDSPPNPTE